MAYHFRTWGNISIDENLIPTITDYLRVVQNSHDRKKALLTYNNSDNSNNKEIEVNDSPELFS